MAGDCESVCARSLENVLDLELDLQVLCNRRIPGHGAGPAGGPRPSKR